jgi:hypothetical protein
MGLAPVLAAVVSAVATLCGALGGIALTSRLEWQRQNRTADRAAADASSAAHLQACTDLLTALTQLRVDVELACARHWRDMNVRLSGIQEQAAASGSLAARVAMLAPNAEGSAALALGGCASKLSAWTARSVSLAADFEGPSNQFVAGQITARPDFSELDELITAFLGLVALTRPTSGAQPVTAADPDYVSQPAR